MVRGLARVVKLLHPRLRSADSPALFVTPIWKGTRHGGSCAICSAPSGRFLQCCSSNRDGGWAIYPDCPGTLPDVPDRPRPLSVVVGAVHPVAPDSAANCLARLELGWLESLMTEATTPFTRILLAFRVTLPQI
jgi:hypothetical protein